MVKTGREFTKGHDEIGISALAEQRGVRSNILTPRFAANCSPCGWYVIIFVLKCQGTYDFRVHLPLSILIHLLIPGENDQSIRDQRDTIGLWMRPTMSDQAGGDHSPRSLLVHTLSHQRQGLTCIGHFINYCYALACNMGCDINNPERVRVRYSILHPSRDADGIKIAPQGTGGCRGGKQARASNPNHSINLERRELFTERGR